MRAGGEGGGLGGGGAEEPGSSVPLTMACGRVTLALLGCMLVPATSNSMVVEKGNADNVSNRVKGQTHEHTLRFL
jgi:hypothetical protein